MFFFLKVILCSIIHNGEKVETAKTSINNEWVKKKKVVHIQWNTIQP